MLDFLFPSRSDGLNEHKQLQADSESLILALSSLIRELDQQESDISEVIALSGEIAHTMISLGITEKEYAGKVYKLHPVFKNLILPQ